jgi:hypothetical protein
MHRVSCIMCIIRIALQTAQSGRGMEQTVWNPGSRILFLLWNIGVQFSFQL